MTIGEGFHRVLDDGEVRLGLVEVGKGDGQLDPEVARQGLECALQSQEPTHDLGVARSVSHLVLPRRCPVPPHEQPLNQLDRVAVAQDPLFEHDVVLIHGEGYEGRSLAGGDLLDQGVTAAHVKRVPRGVSEGLCPQTRRKLFRASALSVFSQENSGSLRPKWP